MGEFKQTPAMIPRELWLHGDQFGDQDAFYLSEILGDDISQVKEIYLDSTNIGSNGFQHIFSALASRSHALERLSIDYSNCPHASEFIEAFSSNANMIPDCLSFDFRGKVSPQGLRDLASVIVSRNSPMKYFRPFMHYGEVENDGVLALIEGLQTNPSAVPKILDFNFDSDEQGIFVAISELLRNRNCSIETLDMIDGLLVSDEAMVHVASSLKTNVNLKSFLMHTSRVTEAAWDYVDSVLCDKSSVENTYTSNHTLEEIGNFDFTENVGYHLAMNRCPDKKKVARLKVLHCHFVENFNDHYFATMESVILVELFRFSYQAFAERDELEANEMFPSRDNAVPENNCLSINYLILKCVLCNLG